MTSCANCGKVEKCSRASAWKDNCDDYTRKTNFQRITQSEETLAEFIYCLQEGFDYYVGNGAKKISQYAMEDANNKNHVELIHGNRDFDELLEWLKQENDTE